MGRGCAFVENVDKDRIKHFVVVAQSFKPIQPVRAYNCAASRRGPCRTVAACNGASSISGLQALLRPVGGAP